MASIEREILASGLDASELNSMIKHLRGFRYTPQGLGALRGLIRRRPGYRGESPTFVAKNPRVDFERVRGVHRRSVSGTNLMEGVRRVTESDGERKVLNCALEKYRPGQSRADFNGRGTGYRDSGDQRENHLKIKLVSIERSKHRRVVALDFAIETGVGEQRSRKPV